MKNTFKFAIFFVIGAFIACQSDPSPKTGEELEKIKAELEAKKKELSDKQAMAEIEKELKDVEKQIKAVDKGISAPSSSGGNTASAPAASAPASGPTGTITGSSVTMRKGATVQSDKLGSFNNNEKVIILETQNVNNENEAILTKAIDLYTGTNQEGKAAMTLPKGKAVVIDRYISEENKYMVSYQDAKQGKLYANIDASAVETITYSTWYKVQRSNGQTGWVLGKFLKV
jgi:hypothetical protein